MVFEKLALDPRISGSRVQFPSGEVQANPELGIVPAGIEYHAALAGADDQLPTLQARDIRPGIEAAVEAQMAEQRGVGPEHETSEAGVYTIGPDDKVRLKPAPTGQGDVNAGGAFMQACNLVAENEGRGTAHAGIKCSR